MTQPPASRPSVAGLAPRAAPRDRRGRRPAARRDRRQPGRQRPLRDRPDEPAAAAPRRCGRHPQPTGWAGRSRMPGSRPSPCAWPTTLGGEVRVVSTDGTTLAAYGTVRTATRPATAPRSTSTAGRSRPWRRRCPAAAADRAFLPLFNVTLIVAGFVSVLGHRARVRVDRGAADPAVARRGVRRPPPRSGRRRAPGRPVATTSSRAELADAFNAMADRLERSEMLRRRAASDIAHDLATPATVLESQLQAMIDGVVPTDLAGLEAARSAAAALGGVVADIDDLARAEAAPLQARPAGGRPRDDDRARSRRPSMASGATRARAHARCRPGPHRVGGSRATWRERSATSSRTRSRHSPAGGTVSVVAHGRARAATASPAPDRSRAIRTRVRASPRTICPHVFERFYRADTARATDPATGRPTGLGLGLTIARELLAAERRADRRGADRDRTAPPSSWRWSGLSGRPSPGRRPCSASARSG